METSETLNGSTGRPDHDRIARLVVDNVADFAIFTTDLDGVVTSWNVGAERLFGWPEIDMCGSDACAIFTPEDLSANACQGEMETARAAGRAEDERWHVRKDGSRFWASGLLMRLEADDGSGAHIGYVKIVRDRTRQHQANEALLDTHRRSAEILESISDAFYAVDGDWRFTYVNRKAEQWWGRSRSDLIGNPLWDEFPQAVGSEAYRAQVEAMEERRPVHIEAWSSVLERWIAADVHPAASGGLAVYFRDITARRAREAELHESEARLRLAVEAARMAIWEFDIVEERLKISPELAAMLGLAEGESGDIDAIRARYHPDDREHMRTAAEAAVAAGERHFEAEFRFRRGEDDWRWFMLRGEIMFGADEAPTRVIGALIDITGRKETEKKLRRLTDTLEEQVGKRTRELLHAEEALRQSQKMEAIGQLTGGVAHDFNNLLTIIRSSVDLLRRGRLSEERKRRYMEAISDTVDRAAKLTGQLLAFARRQALAPEAFDVGERTRRIGDMVRTIVGAQVAVILETDCDTCFIEADTGQFETALVNLAVNARDAMAAVGELRIRIETIDTLPSIRGHHSAGGDFVAISVSDTGSGIPAEALPHIFEPFFTTKEVGKGTGLGLSQVYGFAKQSGGDVAVETKVGRGTTFTLYLPRVAKRAEPRRGPAEPHNEPGAATRILVVEDNIQVGEFAIQLFEELGHSPRLAVNADAALELLEAHSTDFDLVFTDVVMPGRTGIELGEEIRQRWPHLRVVLTSGYSHVLAEQGSHGFELLQKPYSVDGICRVLLAHSR